MPRWGFAAAAALVTAALVLTVLTRGPVPVALVHPFVPGVERRIDIQGGVAVTLRSAADGAPAAIAEAAADRARQLGFDVEIERVGPEVVLDLIGADEAAARRFAGALAPFRMQLVDDGSAFMARVARRAAADPRAAELGVRVEPDIWTTETEARAHEDTALAAATCTRIQSYLAERTVGEPALRVPPGRELVYEDGVRRPGSGSFCRSYLVFADVVLDATAVAAAEICCLLHFFGPWAPVEVVVPGAQAEAALAVCRAARDLAPG